MKDKQAPAPEPEEQAEEAVLDPVVEELKSTAEELKSTKDQLLRLAAEFDNFKKRSQREREEAYLNTKAELFKAFLPVMDNFERACGGQSPAAIVAESSIEDYCKGIGMIFGQFAGVFEVQGVEAFGAAGDAFDPELHNAVMHSENPDLGENVIAEVFSKGWRVGEKLIREATVGVAN